MTDNPKDAIGVRKAKLSVIPAGVLFDIGLAMLEGACKYGRHNYRAAGVRSSVYYDAAMGHLMDWWEGEDIDDESGLSHVTKAIASLVVLRDAMFQQMLTDDRPPRSLKFKRDFNRQAAAIMDKHGDKNPTHYTIRMQESVPAPKACGLVLGVVTADDPLGQFPKEFDHKTNQWRRPQWHDPNMKPNCDWPFL